MGHIVQLNGTVFTILSVLDVVKDFSSFLACAFVFIVLFLYFVLCHLRCNVEKKKIYMHKIASVVKGSLLHFSLRTMYMVLRYSLSVFLYKRHNAKANPPHCVRNAVGNRAKSVSLYYESAGLDNSLALKEKQKDPKTQNCVP